MSVTSTLTELRDELAATIASYNTEQPPAELVRQYESVLSALGETGGGGESGGGGATTIASITSTSTSGTIAAGKTAVAISNIGEAAGTIAGASIPKGTSIKYGNGINEISASVAYDATGTTFLIITEEYTA